MLNRLAKPASERPHTMAKASFLLPSIGKVKVSPLTKFHSEAVSHLGQGPGPCQWQSTCPYLFSQFSPRPTELPQPLKPASRFLCTIPGLSPH